MTSGKAALKSDDVGSGSKASFGRSIKLVAWSFLGIRKNSEYQQDLSSVNPLHIVVVAIAAVFIFVLGLIGFVNWVVAK